MGVKILSLALGQNHTLVILESRMLRTVCVPAGLNVAR